MTTVPAQRAAVRISEITQAEHLASCLPHNSSKMLTPLAIIITVVVTVMTAAVPQPTLLPFPMMTP